MTDGIRDHKAALRRQLLTRRQGLSPAVCEAASHAVGERLRQSPACQRAATIHTYVDALPNEVGTRPFIAWCLERGKRVIVPVIQGRRPPMSHAEIRSLDELCPGPLGLLQPAAAGARWWTEEQGVDLIVVPAVAFDRRGFRIGHGGGFYDVFLATCPGTPTIGLIYDALLLDEVPVEEHDRAVDLVLTETAAHRTTG